MAVRLEQEAVERVELVTHLLLPHLKAITEETLQVACQALHHIRLAVVAVLPLLVSQVLVLLVVTVVRELRLPLLAHL